MLLRPPPITRRYLHPHQLVSDVDLSHGPAQVSREDVSREMAIQKRRRFTELMNKSKNMERLMTMPPEAPPVERAVKCDREIDVYF